MRLVSITAHGRFCAPAPPTPTPTFFRHLCELAELELAACAWDHAVFWYQRALEHVPACCEGQPREVSNRFVLEASRQDNPRMVAEKLCAGCEGVKGALS
jgi:hypothetical protein